VDDYLVKPLSPGQISSRVARAIAQYAQRPQTAGASRSSWLQAGCTVLLVDGDAEFRAFFKKTVGPHATVMTAESGVEAMRLCAELRPHTLLVGSGTGLLTPPLLVKRLRANHQLDAISILAVSMDKERPEWASEGVAGHVTKTFSAAGFLTQLRRAYGTTTADTAPNYADTLATAAEQALGMMLAVHVERLQEHDAPHDGLTATVDLSSSTASANERVWLHCSNDSARAIASAFKTIDVDQVSEADVRSALGELIGIIAGRMQQAMREHGVNRVCSNARVESARPALEATTSVSLRAAAATVCVALATAVDMSADAVA
jgi:CheY-like chemotaxis protein